MPGTMPEVRLRRWRLTDVDDVAVIVDDEQDRHWSTMGVDLQAWISCEVAEERGPTRAVCLPHSDRAIGRVALRLPEFASEAVRCEAVRESDRPAGELSYWVVPEARGRGIARAAVQAMMASVVPATGLRSVVLDIEEGNLPSLRIAQRLGAERRDPTRVKVDRGGTPRTLAVHVLALAPATP